MPLAHVSPAGLAIATTQGRADRYHLPAHLDLLDRTLVEAVTGRGPRFNLVEIPPRHGKSETLSRYSPAWFLGMFPDRRVILASYEADFAAQWGRAARDVIEDVGEEFYGIRLRQDSSAVSRWDIERKVGRRWVKTRGGMQTAGVGGPLTGKGGDLFLIDDPVKNAEEARSKTIQARNRDWYRAVARTRLEPGGVMFVVMARWDENDLGGFLLTEAATNPRFDQFNEIRLPALAEADDPLGRAEGEALWPDRYDREALLALQATLGSYWFSALYQGAPKPAEGMGRFRREWFNVVDEVPADAKRVRYWDLAATAADEGDDPDYTAGVRGALTADGAFYIEDVKKFRASVADRDRILASTTEADATTSAGLVRGRVPVVIEQEPGSSGKSVIVYAKRLLQGYAVRGEKVTGPKDLRANPLAAAAGNGMVFLLRGSWNEDFVEEAVAFPTGAHDDAVDAASGAYDQLTGGGRARVRLLV